MDRSPAALKAAFDEKVVVSGRCSVRVGYYVSQVAVAMACRKWIMMVCGRVNEDVTIE